MSYTLLRLILGAHQQIQRTMYKEMLNHTGYTK
jgi:hypothetical protein